MSQQIQPKWVGGVVDVDPNLTREENRENPYTFWEIDTKDQNQHNLVIQTYLKYGITEFVSQDIGKGFHYFGLKVSRLTWKAWHEELVNLVGNKKFPALTLRVTRKYQDERFERPVYHGNQNPIPNQFRALMHFLSKEMNYTNQWHLKKAMHQCGLDKYFKTVRYPLCPICLVSSPDNMEEHMKKMHGGV